MYNRYIPQPDGTYQRSRVQEPRQHHQDRRPPPPPPKQEPEPCDTSPCKSEPIPTPSPKPCRPDKERPSEHHRHESVPGFLSQLLPKDFDTGDLIVVLLLLLLAGDCEEDRSTALLTLALYLFM